jgi:O-antigen ligase
MHPERLARGKKRPDRWIFGAYLVLLLWLPLPKGSHSIWASSLFGACSGLMLMAWWWQCGADPRRSTRRVRRIWWAVLLWFLWLAWILFQILPLPESWVMTFSPTSGEIYSALKQVDVDSRFAISLAPGVTTQAWLLSAAYFTLYLLTVLMVRSDQRLRWVLMTLLASGLAQAAYGGLMVLSGYEYGWLQKKIYYLGSATGTFVNRNHLAGYLELTAAAGLGLVLADLREWRSIKGLHGLVDRVLELLLSSKLLARVAMLVIAVAMVLTRSRMGNIAFFSAISAGGLLYSLLRWRRDFWPAVFLFSSILVLDILVISNQFGLERLIERIEATHVESEERSSLFAELEPVAQDFALTGAGLGAFQYAYAPKQSELLPGFWDHAHNDYLQFIIETGFIGTFLLALLVGLHLLKALRILLLRRDRLAAGACAGAIVGLLAIGVHSSADFNLQIPANAAAVVVLLGLIGGRSAEPKSRSSRKMASELSNGANSQSA